jgi:hypothetical protein
MLRANSFYLVMKVDSAPIPPHPLVKRLYEMQQQSPGRIVMIKGLPTHFSRARVEKILSRSYALATETKTFTDDQGEKVVIPPVFEIKDITGLGENYATNFLVQLQTVSSAMMLVRRWHRSVWRSKEQEKNKYDRDQTLSLREDINEEDAANDEESSANYQHDTTVIRNWQDRVRPSEPHVPMPGARVLDAYLMY